MKKLLVGAFVGAIILFAWQALSWTVFHIHADAYKYTPTEDSLLSAIKNNLKEEGQYMVPITPPGASHEDMQKKGLAMNGKPWAIITYHSTYKFDMVMPLVRGFLIALLCVIFVCLVIQKQQRKTKLSVLGTSLAFGIVCFLFVWYNQHNWFQTSWSILKGELIDDVASWGLCGIWLGIWYTRR